MRPNRPGRNLRPTTGPVPQLPEEPSKFDRPPPGRSGPGSSAGRVPQRAGFLSGPGSSAALCGDEVPVPAERCLRGAPLRPEVDVHEAEPLVVSFGPLEIVDQRPGQVAAHVNPAGHGLVQGPEVAIQVPDPGLVIDGPVSGYLVIRRGAL